ncbi:class I SAM-dependent methyltransferase [Pedomonas mirosovicensis]|uniref:class I SAM-dependent methyltransferase n=1 Tax=Pedomonas mirosovicensis TaxID=2908641 RepID=UPI0021678484|nr:class I SAM-dependent methyltransferase [Pedomonas mirosovicensis]MCH8684363.1 class I SAM-dependent methyltransferase [Pedomonas mirosovicensis]
MTPPAANIDPKLELLITEPWADFELLDSGNGRKLERYGKYRFIRPEPQALWQPALPNWDADAEFVPGSTEDTGKWQFARQVPDAWPLARGDIRFWGSCTPFRHLAFFPDMAPQWDFMRRKIEGAGGEPEVLNLFGYTGLASLICADAGARVTHVDASKKAITAAVENQKLSGLTDKPIRWLVEDAGKFLAREVRRGRTYQGLILDPPKYGRGPKGEIWKLFEQLPELLQLCRQVLDKDSLFLILTVYAIRASSLAFAQAVEEALKDLGGRITFGEMAIRESSQRGNLIPTALFVRWEGERG